MSNTVTNHTPGPWVSEQTHSMLWIWDFPKQKIVASCHNEDDLKDFVIEQNKANFALIAAAPELLEALQQVVACDTLSDHLKSVAQSAINKALNI